MKSRVDPSGGVDPALSLGGAWRDREACHPRRRGSESQRVISYVMLIYSKGFFLL